MTDAQLDDAYAALARATTRVGETKAPLMLAALALALIAREDDAGQVLALIAQAERIAQE